MRVLMGLLILLGAASMTVLTGCETAAQRQAREMEAEEDLINKGPRSSFEEDLYSEE